MNPKDKKAQVDALIRKMEDGIRDIFSSENYAQYLKTMSRFHRYSFRNQLLIHMQNPQATLCAGYVAWQNKFERHVKKGERGIRILVPYRHKYRKRDETGTEDDSKRQDADEEREYITYHIGNVYDISQTEGKPIPAIVHDLEGDVEEYEAFMEAVNHICPVSITRKELQPNLDGYFSPTEKRIVLRDGKSQVQEAAAVIHEMAHAVLHNPEDRKSDETKKDKQTIEVEAESVSNVVCSYFGIDTKENSWGYIAIGRPCLYRLSLRKLGYTPEYLRFSGITITTDRTGAVKNSPRENAEVEMASVFLVTYYKAPFFVIRQS